jgi:hypothetical protein
MPIQFVREVKNQKNGLKNLVNFILNKNKNLSKWLEIGSYVGESAKIFLSFSSIKELYCVDPWDKNINLVLNSMPFLKNNDVKCLKKLFLKHLEEEINSKRCIPIQNTSLGFFKQNNENFDVIYIDGHHGYYYVLIDLCMWYTKLNLNGFLCGHDFCFDRNNLKYSVTSALFDFLNIINKENEEVELHIFSDGSWCFQKVRNFSLQYFKDTILSLKMNNLINSKNIPTIHQLRRAGWKVRVIHGFTNQHYIGNEITNFSDRFTKIQITSSDQKNAEGVAFCSKQDQWNRKLGNRIALGRAIKNYKSVHEKNN